MGVTYDTYKSYILGFLGVGAVGVLGALILPAIASVLPHNSNGQNGHFVAEKAGGREDAKESKKDNLQKTELKKDKALEKESNQNKKSERAESEEGKVSQRRL